MRSRRACGEGSKHLTIMDPEFNLREIAKNLLKCGTLTPKKQLTD